jgi:hypothetical protein
VWESRHAVRQTMPSVGKSKPAVRESRNYCARVYVPCLGVYSLSE